MPTDSNGKASAGSPFKAPPATIWNNMVAAGLAFGDGQLSGGPPDPTQPRASDLLRLKNSSGASRRKGEILKIEGKVIEDITDENIWLDGKATTSDCRFGILKAPAEGGDVVTAQVAGACLALVNITNVNHTCAVAVGGEYVLQSGNSGPLEIVLAPSGTGELECVVRFAAPKPLIVEMLATVGPGKAGSAKTLRVTNDIGSLASGATITLGDTDPARTVVVVNFRPNYLAIGVAYIAHPIGGLLVIENDACFQDFMS